MGFCYFVSSNSEMFKFYITTGSHPYFTKRPTHQVPYKVIPEAHDLEAFNSGSELGFLCLKISLFGCNV